MDGPSAPLPLLNPLRVAAAFLRAHTHVARPLRRRASARHLLPIRTVNQHWTVD